MCHHYLFLHHRSDTVGSPGSYGGRRRWICHTFQHINQEEMHFNRWGWQFISFLRIIVNTNLKFKDRQMQPLFWDAPSTKIEIFPQSFDTSGRWVGGRFASYTLFCGAQPIFGEQKMSLWEHFVCSPLRCLKSFQSSPSWNQRGCS